MAKTPNIQVIGKERNPGSGMFFTDGEKVFIGRDYALQNQIDEAKAKTEARGCYKACRTCNACANSRRGTSYPRQFDSKQGKTIDCRGCEPFRFHDCNNGFMRNTHQEAEPFTPDQQKLIDESDGKPLI